MSDQKQSNSSYTTDGKVQHFSKNQEVNAKLSEIIGEKFIAYRKRTDWLVHHAGRELTTFAAEYWQPRFELDYFVSAKQQFRVILQWVGVKAAERQRWQVPDGDGSLVLKEQPHTNNRDFSISNVSFQARYRWEIAPLSDLFLVYTRGSNLRSGHGESFSELLHDGWTEREADSLAIKLRYRIGN